jgi:hypothetical protein
MIVCAASHPSPSTEVTASKSPLYVHSGQLDWQPIGTARAAACGADSAMVVDALPTDGLLAWIGAK